MGGHGDGGVGDGGSSRARQPALWHGGAEASMNGEHGMPRDGGRDRLISAHAPAMGRKVKRTTWRPGGTATARNRTLALSISAALPSMSRKPPGVPEVVEHHPAAAGAVRLHDHLGVAVADDARAAGRTRSRSAQAHVRAGPSSAGPHRARCRPAACDRNRRSSPGWRTARDPWRRGSHRRSRRWCGRPNAGYRASGTLKSSRSCPWSRSGAPVAMKRRPSRLASVER